MSVVAQILALVVAAVHLLAFAWESLLMQRPGVHHGIFRIRTEDLPPIRLWSFNVGFYNLFLAAGPVAGVIAYHAGAPAAGQALALYACGFAFLAGCVLLISDRLAMSRPKGAGVAGALSQSLPAAAAITAVVLV